MALQLIYLVFSKLLSWMVLRTRSDTTKDVKILVLRHQLAVIHRRTPRPRFSWPDRALIRLLPTSRRLGFLLTPATILRWHQQLVTRHWTTQPSRSGRPSISAGLRALAVRLATAPLRPLPQRIATEIHNVERRNRFGGLLHEYQQVA